MIAAAAIASTLLYPIGDTTWWRTDGAEVTQESDQNACALFFFRQQNAVGFLWDKTALTGIVFFNEGWNFAPHETQAAIRIGDYWISKTSGIDWLPATEESNALMVPVRYSVEPLLKGADAISVRHQNVDFSITVDKKKIPKLLAAVTTCRQHLAR